MTTYLFVPTNPLDQIGMALNAMMDRDERRSAGQSPPGKRLAKQSAPAPVKRKPLSPDRIEAGKFLAAFGDEGFHWFAEGKTFDEATELHQAKLKAEADRLAAEARRAEREAERLANEAAAKRLQLSTGLPFSLALVAVTNRVPR